MYIIQSRVLQNEPTSNCLDYQCSSGSLTWGLKLTTRSKGRHTVLMSCLQMKWKEVLTQTFPRMLRQLNPIPLALEDMQEHGICLLFFFYLLLRQSIPYHSLSSCGYVTCSRPQQTATGGLEPGSSRPKVLSFTIAPVRSTDPSIGNRIAYALKEPYTLVYS